MSRSFRAHSSAGSARPLKRRSLNSPGARRLRFETLEERRLLSITVNTLVDENNGVGVGGISLRDAIAAAAPGDTINFAPTLTSSGPATIPLTHGELAITKAVSIVGPGATLLTIDASGNDTFPLVASGTGSRVFNIDDQSIAFRGVLIYGLTLTGGDMPGEGGAILNQETLTLDGCAIKHNVSAARGGGIANHGGLLVTNSTIADNSAYSYYSASGPDSGGIYTDTSITIRLSRITGNSAASYGGGIFANQNANLTITSTTISGNSCGPGGGGVLVSTGTLIVDACTISDNHSEKQGAGILAGGGNVSLVNSTISGNRCAGNGGGIYLSDSNASTVIRYCTITKNTANDFGGGLFLTGGTAVLDDTIIASNIANTGGDLTGLIGSSFDASYCIIGNGEHSGLAESPFGFADSKGNFIGGSHGSIDPGLGGLIDNGGPVWTHALLEGSVAINGGNPAASAGQGGVPAGDARGAPFTRVAGARMDIGAYERQTVAGLNLVVDTPTDVFDGNYSAGNLSLREAIGLANGSIGPNSITFTTTLTSAGAKQINLSVGALPITDSLVLQGPGSGLLKIVAAPNDSSHQIFSIDDSTPNVSTVAISGLTLSGITGYSYGSVGAAINNQEALTVTNCTITGNSVPAIYNGTAADMSVIGCTVSNNSNHYSGGGVANFGNATVSSCTITGNMAYSGGGILNGGVLSLSNSTISGNSSSHEGGAVSNFGSITVMESTLSGNSSSDGGGIWSQGGVAITQSTISGNSALINGGLTLLGNSPSSIKNSTVTQNIARSDEAGGGFAGGIWVAAAGLLSVENTIVAGNSKGTALPQPSDIAGPVALRYAILGTNTNASITNNGGNQIGTPPVPIDARLGPLVNNGGATATHALLPGSPALNAGDPLSIAGANGVPPFDQRGSSWSRVSGGRIDIGAFESQANPLSGDYNFDHVVDAADYVLYRKSLGSTNDLRADGNGNGAVDQADFNSWRTRFGTALQTNASTGDYSSNTAVDASDYVTWRKMLGSTTDLRADGNGNGIVDSADYTYWRARFGNVLASASALPNAEESSSDPAPITEVSAVTQSQLGLATGRLLLSAVASNSHPSSPGQLHASALTTSLSDVSQNNEAAESTAIRFDLPTSPNWSDADVFEVSRSVRPERPDADGTNFSLVDGAFDLLSSESDLGATAPRIPVQL